MPINPSRAVDNAISKLEAAGFDCGNEHSKQRDFVKAVIEALSEEITANAKAIDPGGTSPGQWQIK